MPCQQRHQLLLCRHEMSSRSRNVAFQDPTDQLASDITESRHIPDLEGNHLIFYFLFMFCLHIFILVDLVLLFPILSNGPTQKSYHAMALQHLSPPMKLDVRVTSVLRYDE